MEARGGFRELYFFLLLAAGKIAATGCGDGADFTAADSFVGAAYASLRRCRFVLLGDGFKSG